MRTFGQIGAVTIWSAFRHPSHRFPRVMPVKAGIISFMSMAAALCTPQHSQAQQITGPEEPPYGGQPPRYQPPFNPSLADAQVKAVYGVLPTQIPQSDWLAFGGFGCEQGDSPSRGGFPAGTSLQDAIGICLKADADIPNAGTSYRTDLGVDSRGELPPLLTTINPTGRYDLYRCTGFYYPSPAATSPWIVCNLWGFTNTVQLTAADQTAKAHLNQQVTIDLTANYTGVQPTSATLVGQPVGGTVIGFPSTTVTFTLSGTPSITNFLKPSGFAYTLSGSGLTSNQALVTVYPDINSPQAQSNVYISSNALKTDADRIDSGILIEAGIVATSGNVKNLGPFLLRVAADHVYIDSTAHTYGQIGELVADIVLDTYALQQAIRAPALAELEAADLPAATAGAVVAFLSASDLLVIAHPADFGMADFRLA